MFHHSRSKSAPCYNFNNEKANQILFSNTLPVPHTPESLLNWQFGDAPAHSPRRDISYGPAISTSTNSIKQQQQTFALDNQFFNGGVLDWDVSIDTISTAIEETKKAKETTPTFQVPQFPSNRMIKSVRDGDDVDYLKPMSYPTRLMGSINNTGSHEEHRRHASFTCFPNIQDMNLTEEQIEEIYHPLKKKKFSANSSNSDTNQADDSSVAPSASSPLSPTSPSSCGADNVAPSSMKKKKVRSLVRSSGFRGVSKCSKDGRWQARIRVGESVRYLGRFLTQEEAALCYDNAARMYHGSKAILNFKGPGDEHLTQSKKLASMVARMERKIEFEVV